MSHWASDSSMDSEISQRGKSEKCKVNKVNQQTWLLPVLSWITIPILKWKYKLWKWNSSGKIDGFWDYLTFSYCTLGIERLTHGAHKVPYNSKKFYFISDLWSWTSQWLLNDNERHIIFKLLLFSWDYHIKPNPYLCQKAYKNVQSGILAELKIAQRFTSNRAMVQ